MGRKIIVLERVGEPSDFNFQYVFWADVPQARQSYYSDQNKTSFVKDVTAQELQDIRDGKILEKFGTAGYLAGTNAATIKADLISKFNEYQADVNTLNPFKFYGTSWDGSVWTNAGVN